MAEDFAVKHRNVTYSNNTTMTLRQEPGLYASLTGSSANYTGSTKHRIENRFGRLRMHDKTQRHGDTDTQTPTSTTRWIKPGPLNTLAVLLDIQDQQETQVDLESPIVKESAAAARTYHDDMVFTGFFGLGYEGEGGDTAVPFKSANIVPHGGVGITKDKLIALREMARKRNAPIMREKPIILLQPEDESDLFGIPEYVNLDYGGGAPLADGEIKPWLGFRFFPVNPDAESLPKSFSSFFTDSGTTRRLPVIFPSGLHRGVWTEFMGRLTERDDKDFDTQVWAAARSAVVRTDEDLAFILETK